MIPSPLFKTGELCPAWCPYMCLQAWQRGQCLIRTPEKTAELKAAFDQGVKA